MTFSEYDELLVWRCDTCGLRAKCPQEQGFGTSWNELKRAYGWRATRDGDWEDASWSHHCRRCWRAAQQKIAAELFGGKDMAQLFGGKERMKMRDSADLKAKLLANIVKRPGPLESECWIWQGPFYSNGYGCFCYVGIHDGAHRVAYREFVGPIPDGMQINHHCDEKACLRSEHLYAGTQQQNVDDMWARGRVVTPDRTGSLHPQARLNEIDVREILQALSEGESQAVIADERGVSRGIIGDIAHGKAWMHVPGPRPDKRKSSSSRFVGVSKRYADDGSGKWKWAAHIHFEGKKHHLGRFCFEVDAAIAYNYAVAYHGLVRSLNEIPEGEWAHD
jgi:hypothetical protein